MPNSTHKYGAGTRLSNAYTMGADGKPFAPHLGNKTSAAYKAWQQGYNEFHNAGGYLVHVLVADDCEGYVQPETDVTYRVGALRSAKEFTLYEARQYVKDCGTNTHLLTIVRITPKEST